MEPGPEMKDRHVASDGDTIIKDKLELLFIQDLRFKLFNSANNLIVQQIQTIH